MLYIDFILNVICVFRVKLIKFKYENKHRLKKQSKN